MITPSHPRRTRKEVRLGKNPDVVYCEEDRIGQGQFGTVYRGRCPATDTVVAVKMLRDIPAVGVSEAASTCRPDRTTAPEADGRENSTSTPKPRPRFPSELELLWALRGDHCPNIVHVLSVWNKPRKHHSTGGTTSAERRSSSGGGNDGSPPPSSTSTAASSPRRADTHERHSNMYVLVTEYCEGGDLQHRLQALDSNVPTHVARSFTYQLCNALYTLKRRRIVHRDIKPANLLLTSRDWETATLKVGDFGMAKAAPAPTAVRKGEGAAAAEANTEDSDAAAGLMHDVDGDESNPLPSTLFYSEVGTPMYMSPERIAGQPYDYKADVYSAGMVLLEMLLGSCVRVTRVSQLRTMVPETIQRIRRRYTAKGGEAPVWLDLVQKMTATDPAQRYSVEEVLRHPWFAAGVGPALPPLTFELPSEEREMEKEPAAAEDAGRDGGRSVEDARLTGHDGAADQAEAAAPLKSAATDAAATASAKHAVHDATAVLPPPIHTEADRQEENDAGISTPARGEHRQGPPSSWSLLGVCTGIELQHNTARCVCTGPTPKSKHSGLASVNHVATATTAAAAVSAAAALALPAACGPHVITHAVRGFVDSVYLYALQDELDPVGGLTLISFLVELVQNGFGAYLECLESLGSGGGAGTSTTATAGTDGPSALENSSGVCIDGHRFVVKEVGGLPEVWQRLMVRLSHAKTVYTAQLPPRMLQNAALWRRRVLRTTTGGAAAAEDGVKDADAEDSNLYAASTSSSEEEAAMPGLPNVASITNVAAAAHGPMLLPAAATTTTTAAAAAAGGAGSPPLRAYTLSTRAEQLIFEKAVDYLQSEALAVLMTPPTLPPPPQDCREEGQRRMGEPSGDRRDLDTTDCLEEEEEASKIRHSRVAPVPPSPSASSSRRLSSTTTAGANTSAAASTAHAAMPPHRGIALLRVLLQRAVLSVAQVGLEPEGPFAARSPPLEPSAVSPVVVVTPRGDAVNNPFAAPTRTSSPSSTTVTAAVAAVAPSTNSWEGGETEAGGYAFVVQVPVYATLQRTDVEVVENLLCAATRVFTNCQRSA
ncbi:hypothetical protein ABB37_06380 [Leptomonas pyrrhocoris]|uniref:Protein kinase domain-containing protein n=1 Tax=Leptomonas pyrrhocoris TaxID=157538 RepID=A0A0M9FXY9_LEPPY|nr:hypothetical protein ABB37_06380 [Leptomonas pyrrhocoris]KPA78219.1 hypothetical protein ABB37_06380 [Leptomonas pyrrhocoris]|eukprot:XP_015656658.1 hypothetical protein ABB37_06380 [Leptomonas pyrrhocoris]